LPKTRPRPPLRSGWGYTVWLDSDRTDRVERVLLAGSARARARHIARAAPRKTGPNRVPPPPWAPAADASPVRMPQRTRSLCSLRDASASNQLVSDCRRQPTPWQPGADSSEPVLLRADAAPVRPKDCQSGVSIPKAPSVNHALSAPDAPTIKPMSFARHSVSTPWLTGRQSLVGSQEPHGPSVSTPACEVGPFLVQPPTRASASNVQASEPRRRASVRRPTSVPRLRCCLRGCRTSSVCVCCDAACLCVAPHLFTCAAMLLACASHLSCLRLLRRCLGVRRPSAAMLLARVTPLSCLRVLRYCLRVRYSSAVCVCCDAACMCVASQLSACAAMLLACVLPLNTQRSTHVCRPSAVCVFCYAACVSAASQLSVLSVCAAMLFAPQLSASAAMLRACASPLSCLRVLRLCLRVRRPSAVCVCTPNPQKKSQKKNSTIRSIPKPAKRIVPSSVSRKAILEHNFHQPQQ
jgi:hypothetical protein